MPILESQTTTVSMQKGNKKEVREGENWEKKKALILTHQSLSGGLVLETMKHTFSTHREFTEQHSVVKLKDCLRM